MAQLLSMDYQQQWLEESRHKDEEQRRKAKVRSLRTILLVYVHQGCNLLQVKRLAAKKKLEEHTMRATRVSNVEHSSGSRFIMKR